MTNGLASVREVRSVTSTGAIVRSFEDAWRYGEPELEKHWKTAQDEGNGTVSTLVALVKVDLAGRYSKGRKPKVAEYLERFPELRSNDDRVLSLIYEEFCLREEAGDCPDAEDFCDEYEPWRDSLVSQLRYHRLLSQVVGPQKPTTRFPEPGDKFEEFHLESLLGQGGAGRVYLARDESLAGRRVALKVSLDSGREPAILGRLDHKHIVPVHSVVFQRETCLRGLCMPYRPGLPLDQVIRQLNPAGAPRQAAAIWETVARSVSSDTDEKALNRSGWQAFPFDRSYTEGVAWLIATLAKAISYAHSQGILHRDVKPANILLTLRDGPQLLDFNLAHDPHSPDQAETALRGGTLPYMAPEQLEAFLDPECWGRVGASADLYSLGLVMHELLTGEAPGLSDPSLPLPRAIRSLLDRRAAFPVSPTRELNPAVPHALEAITRKCLEASPADRYSDALELAEDLQCFLDRRPLRHAYNPSIKERLSNWSRRNRRGLGVAAVVLLVGGMALSSPITRALIPMESRESFQRAIDDIEASRFLDAIPSLERLVEEFPESPLPHFYLGIAVDARGDRDGASLHFAKVLAFSDGEAKLLAWGEKHPRLAGQLETLGLTLLNQKYHDLARRAFKLALKLDPTLMRSRGGAAYVYAFLDRDYPKAHALFTAIIDEAESRDSNEDRNLVVDWYIERARTAVLWGELTLQGRGKNASAVARARFLEAMADLDRVDSTLNTLDRERVFLTKKVRTETLISLGKLEAANGVGTDSARYFQEAQRIVKVGLEPNGRDQRQDCLRLEQLLEGAMAGNRPGAPTIDRSHPHGSSRSIRAN